MAFAISRTDFGNVGCVCGGDVTVRFSGCDVIAVMCDDAPDDTDDV